MKKLIDFLRSCESWNITSEIDANADPQELWDGFKWYIDNWVDPKVAKNVMGKSILGEGGLELIESLGSEGDRFVLSFNVQLGTYRGYNNSWWNDWSKGNDPGMTSAACLLVVAYVFPEADRVRKHWEKVFVSRSAHLSVAQLALFTGKTEAWVERALKSTRAKVNLPDQRQNNRKVAHMTTPEIVKFIAEKLGTPPPDNERRWKARHVAQAMSVKLGQPVRVQRGAEVLKLAEDFNRKKSG